MPKPIQLLPDFVRRLDQEDDTHCIKWDQLHDYHTTSARCWCLPELTYLDPETHRAVYTHKTQEELCQ